jgi:hypothetical protein
MSKSTHHILCISGGKDPTAQALYRRDRVSESEHYIAFLALHCCFLGKLSLRED